MNNHYALRSKEGTFVIDVDSKCVQIFEEERHAKVVKRYSDTIVSVCVSRAGMTPLKQLTDEKASNAANAKALDLHPHQLKRWLDNDAHVDQEGNVYIRTKGSLAGCVAVKQESEK